MTRRTLFSMLLLSALLFTAALGCDGVDGATGAEGPPGPAGPEGPPGLPGDEPTTAVEACAGCHGDGRAVPVGNILDAQDAHHIDTDPRGPATASGYRQLNIAIGTVDVTGSSVEIDFEVTDETGSFVPDIFASDGRFTIAKLVPGASMWDSDDWSSFITRVEDPGGVGDGPGTPELQANAERFDPAGFQYLGNGSYRYTSDFDPAPIAQGDSVRVAIQLSAADIPAGNGWCDFDADLTSANDCSTGASLTRDIVETATCNGCHGVTSDTKLALHGGGRTQVEYCVTCHNPGSTDANSGNSVDFKIMIHKIHYGAQLANGYKIWGFNDSLHDYSTVDFTKDIDDCTNCHQGNGAQVDNWSMLPTREACGSCHDDVNFDNGANHGSGGRQMTNENCHSCHPPNGPRGGPDTPPLPVQTVHRGVLRAAEGALYAGPGDGFAIEQVSQTGSDLTVQYSVTRDGAPMSLESDPEWNAGGASRLAILVGWDTSDYTNEGSGATPAQPISIDGLDVGGAATALGGGLYEVVASLPGSASNTVTVAIEGHPAADLDLPPDGVFSDRIAVRNVLQYVDVEGGRSTVEPRRTVVDVGKCNACHDSAGNGISLHGNNRTGETQVCVLCHNADATDIDQRPTDPGATADGKREEAIDFKRMVHQIHSGAELQNGLVIYGFGGQEHDFSHVEFIGNRENCETCHLPDTYATENAGAARATTIDTGDDAADPSDDLNISPTAAVCSACHDDAIATDHMKRNGASFSALDRDIF
jgi:OmcA/MtrC family decaheme c-type cytochrome